jgi:hypothetical protein
MTFYLTPAKAAAEAAEAEIFAAFREKIRAIDPEAVAADGTLIGRNAATGELMPDATRTTGYFGEPQPAVQGWFHPQPAEQELQLTNPTATGVEVVANLNPWPVRMMGGDPEPLPTWVQPTGATTAYPLGMMVTHEGLDYRSTLAANVWAPSPESNFWDVVPPLPPQPWRQPTGSADSYNIGDRVTHVVAGRDTDLWESNIAANVTEPGTDSTFDRWWRPITDAGTEPVEWVQPVPGTAAAPYDRDAVVLFEGERYTNTIQLNVWPPAGPGAFGWAVEGTAFTATGGDAVAAPKKSRMQKLASLRRRDAGKFIGDNPATPDVNEAWK